jgi:hypothetical protein
MNIETMGKEQLRAECRLCGIKYGKLDNKGMREALRTFGARPDEEFEDEPVATPPRPLPAVFTQHLKQTTAVAPQEPTTDENYSAVGQAWAGLVQTKQPPSTAKAHPKRRTSKGVKIEANREERNGLRRPSIGAVTREVWDFCDRAYAASGFTAKCLSLQLVKNAAVLHGWNKTMACLNYYAWQKFMGISKSQAPVA